MPENEKGRLYFAFRRSVVVLLVVVVFSGLIIDGLAKGGRWDLYEQVVMSERNVDLFYGMESAEKYAPKTLYFPGLALVAKLIPADNIEVKSAVLLVAASVVAATLLGLLWWVAVVLGVPSLLALVTVLASTVFLANWRAYAIEFKPDSIVLVLTIVALFFFSPRTQTKKHLWLSLAATIPLLVAAALFKQQAVAVYVGLFLYSVFGSSKSLGERIIEVSGLMAAGVITLGIVLLIPNCFDFAVRLVGRHPLQPIKELLALLKQAILAYFPLWILLGVYLVQVLKTGWVRVAPLEQKWSLVSFSWLAVSLLSAAKVGGNLGNVEVGLLPLLPLALLGVGRSVSDWKNTKVLFTAAISLLLVASVLNLGAGVIRLTGARKADAQLRAYLRELPQGSKALVDGGALLDVRIAGIAPMAEIDTAVGTYGLAGQNIEDFYRAIERGEFDLVVSRTPVALFGDTRLSSSLQSVYQLTEDERAGGFVYLKKVDQKKSVHSSSENSTYSDGGEILGERGHGNGP